MRLIYGELTVLRPRGANWPFDELMTKEPRPARFLPASASCQLVMQTGRLAGIFLASLSLAHLHSQLVVLLFPRCTNNSTPAHFVPRAGERGWRCKSNVSHRALSTPQVSLLSVNTRNCLALANTLFGPTTVGRKRLLVAITLTLTSAYNVYLSYCEAGEGQDN
jgi:hypothetical protein